MTRKRFIKLCMGQFGWGRNRANMEADYAILFANSYKLAYICCYSSLIGGTK